MITAEDIERFREMQQDKPTKTVYIDTLTLFTIEIPADIDAQTFIDSQIGRDECAEQIKQSIVGLQVAKVDYDTD